MSTKDEFKDTVRPSDIKTGFYFARGESGANVVRVLFDQVYFITKADEDDDLCYREYPIRSREEFLESLDEQFIKLRLKADPDLNLYESTDIYVHPDVFEFISYYPGCAPSLSLSLHPRDISAFWELECEPEIDDPRILYVNVIDPDQNFFEGLHHINKAYMRHLLESGEITHKAQISPGDAPFEREQFLDKLRADNYARAARFENKDEYKP